MLTDVASAALHPGAAETIEEVMIVSAPTLDPSHHTLSVAPPPDEFHPGERVWVHRSGSWRPGVVLHSSPKAVTVRYRPAEGRGTGVDTVTGPCIAMRDDDDPFLDRDDPGDPVPHRR
jgi:hypothetical protein